MQLSEYNNEFRLKLGGCGCCSTERQLIIDETEKVVPNNEDNCNYWCEMITIDDVNKAEQYLMEQRKLLYRLRRIINPPNPFTYDDVPF